MCRPETSHFICPGLKLYTSSPGLILYTSYALVWDFTPHMSWSEPSHLICPGREYVQVWYFISRMFWVRSVGLRLCIPMTVSAIGISSKECQSEAVEGPFWWHIYSHTFKDQSWIVCNIVSIMLAALTLLGRFSGVHFGWVDLEAQANFIFF